MITAIDTVDIRKAVLRPAQPVEESIYPNDENPGSIHLGAFERGRLIGVASFLPEPHPDRGTDGEWRLRGMALLHEYRNRGIGGGLLDRGVAGIRARGGTALWCNGRTTARRFYERHGMHHLGEEFMSPGTGMHYQFYRGLGDKD